MRYLKNRRCAAGIALMLGSCMILAGCGQKESVEAEAAADVVVEMQQARTGSLTLQNSFVGSISPQEQVYVIPFASGTVTEVNYQVGDFVNKGDVLFKIDDESAQMQLKQAQLSAETVRQQIAMTNGSQQDASDLQLEGSKVSSQSSFEQAQIGYYQVQNNYDKLDGQIEELEENIEKLELAIQMGAGVSGNEGVAQMQSQLTKAKEALAELEAAREKLYPSLLQAESGYRAAQSGKDITDKSTALSQGALREDARALSEVNLELSQLGVEGAELALSYCTVTAPISGVIQSRSVEVNGIAASSNPAFTIANENTMTVTFQVSESVRNTLKVGDSITVERHGENYNGTITEVGVAVNMQTGLFQVKASVDADGTVLPNGVSVKITADTYRADNEVLIPYDAVYYDNNGSYVYLCVDNKAVKTYVTTDIFDDTTIAIVDGISAGDMVITSWSPRLMDGVAVTASDTAAK